MDYTLKKTKYKRKIYKETKKDTFIIDTYYKKKKIKKRYISYIYRYIFHRYIYKKKKRSKKDTFPKYYTKIMLTIMCFSII